MSLLLDIDNADVTLPVALVHGARSAIAEQCVRGRSPWYACCDLPSLDYDGCGPTAVRAWGSTMAVARASVAAQLRVLCEAGDPTVDDLKTALRDLGQSTVGTKTVLASRLCAAWLLVEP